MDIAVINPLYALTFLSNFIRLYLSSIIRQLCRYGSLRPGRAALENIGSRLHQSRREIAVCPGFRQGGAKAQGRNTNRRKCPYESMYKTGHPMWEIGT